MISYYLFVTICNNQTGGQYQNCYPKTIAYVIWDKASKSVWGCISLALLHNKLPQKYRGLKQASIISVSVDRSPGMTTISSVQGLIRLQSLGHSWALILKA